MVINIRGTSGSGKSTVVYEIMKKGVVTPLDANRKPEGYRVDIPGLQKPVYVVGPYVTVCGGCDAISTQDEICRRIREYSRLGHVLVEGLLMSHSFARYVALDRELFAWDETHCIWGFLDTPLEICLDRVRARREERRLAKSDPPPFKELNVKNTTDKWKDNREVYQKFLKARYSDWKLVPKFGWRGSPVALDARWVPYLTATETVFSWLD
ncbi:MAG: hypothetical protein NUV51_09490 [Sulfuricaulis sp.]|nr:hypothetical protein [Sulfuricaulis sp.]